MARHRWIALDDTDPNINYIGTWFQDSGSKDKIGSYGPPYLHTLHGNSVGGSVEFEFSGTAIEVHGTKDAQSSLNPTFECFVDGARTNSVKSSRLGKNNVAFCSQTLPDGHHNLRIDVHVASKNQTFWLDQLRYVPSSDVPLDNKVILFENTDPAIQLDSQWTSLGLGGIANMTRHKNSTAQVKFVGSSVSWVARIPTGLPHTEASATWAIDGGEATQFILPGLPAADSPTLLNQVYFTTPEVEVGPHTLTVTFLGDDQTTPLCIGHLYIKNGTFPNPDQDSRDKPGPSSSGSHIGAILGSVLGGLAFLVIIMGIILFWRRRRARQKGGIALAEETVLMPFFSGRGPNSIAQIREPKLHATPHISAPEAVLTPEQQRSMATRKQREVRGRAAAHLNDEVGQTGRVSAFSGASASLPHVATTEANAVVNQHMDSGIRLAEQSVVDVPPRYTPE